MNLDGSKVNHAALDQAAADMQTTVKQIDDRLNRLESDLNPLKSDWAGSAQTQYLVAKQKWDGAIHYMRELLIETHVSLSQSTLDYSPADTRCSASFAR